jgi:Protein of unknown function (DUF1573)
MQLKAEQSVVDVAYPFKNDGKEPVSILKVEPSCGCMSPNNITGVYVPGEGGVLKIRYHVGDKLGTVVEGVAVHTSDPADETINLRLTVAISVSFHIEPGFLSWGVGEPAEAREVYLFDLSETGVKPVLVYSPDDNFTVTILPQPEQHRYALRVTPLSTESEGATNIYVDVDLGGGRIRKAKFIAAVRAPGTKKLRLPQ